MTNLIANKTKEDIVIKVLENIVIASRKTRDAAKRRLKNKNTQRARELFKAAEDASWEAEKWEYALKESKKLNAILLSDPNPTSAEIVAANDAMICTRTKQLSYKAAAAKFIAVKNRGGGTESKSK